MNYEFDEDEIDLILNEKSDILGRACLDKHIFNPEMTRRLIEDISVDANSLSVTPNQNGIKRVTECELKSRHNSFFDECRVEMQYEFQRRMLEKVSQYKLDRYFDILSNIWIKGANVRESDDVLSLESSIYNFYKTKITEPNDFVRKKLTRFVSPLFSIDELIHLLLVNKDMLSFYFDRYASYCFEKGEEDVTSSGIWLHRGIHIRNPLETSYKENRFLNSYTTSVPVVEQFSQIQKGKINALISAKLFDLCDRVFAYHAFIPNMNADQQEFVLIPPARNVSVRLVHRSKSLYEYELV